MEVALRRFYFHLSAGTEIALDEEGTELPDLSAAKGEAVLAARELLADAIKSGDPTFRRFWSSRMKRGDRSQTYRSQPYCRGHFAYRCHSRSAALGDHVSIVFGVGDRGALRFGQTTLPNIVEWCARRGCREV